MKNTCLTSQRIRKLIKENCIKTNENFKDRIQPSSFEPVVSDEVFILGTETKGMFRPKDDDTVYNTLLHIPKQKQRVTISDGFELKKGYTYLVRLQDKIKMTKGMHIKSSPKSSLGRLFLNTRLVSDFNNCFDEINYEIIHKDKDLELWLYVQPLAFNVILHQGLTLNQLRFINGYGSQLSQEDLSKEQLLWTKEGDKLVPAEQKITDGIEIHLDLSGKHTQGIVGLRAKTDEPTPIDLSKIGFYETENFFEPISVKDARLNIRNSEYYLFASSEVLCVPKHLNVELASHSHIGFSGPLHFAGFIDNGFKGDLVFEVRSDEISNIELTNGMPISKLLAFRTEIPDKLYGKEIGSNYSGQIGCRPPKYFKDFDFARAARAYKKLDRLVLVQDAKLLLKFREGEEGFEFINPEKISELFNCIQNGFFQSRYDCEDDPLVLQPIAYMLLFGPSKTIFSYVRAQNIEDYGDERLFGKHSVGVGGHIAITDAPDYVINSLKREVNEEVKTEQGFSEPKLAGTMMAYDTPVDTVHFGLIYKSHTKGDVMPKESSIKSGRMLKLEEIASDPMCEKKYETWSRKLVPYLNEIYSL